MDQVFCGFLILFFLHLRHSEASEYKLCATAEHEPLCKWIEASRNEISCVKVSDSVDCLLKMQKKEADFGTFYPEEGFLAARFLGDEGTVLAEVRHPERPDSLFGFETVAVVKKTMFGGLAALKGANYCHPGFSKAQYWSDRVLKAFEKKVLEHFADDVKCNSAARSAYEDELYRLSSIFGKACRPGTWAVSDWWDKKLSLTSQDVTWTARRPRLLGICLGICDSLSERDYHTLCDQCEHPTTCSYKVRNKGRHSDALRCLTLGGGNVTYTALEFVKEYFELDSDEGRLNPEYKLPSRYAFLCPDGSTRPLDGLDSCSWIKQPWTAVVAHGSESAAMLASLKEWLAGESSQPWTNHLRTILAKGNGVLKFRDRPIRIADYIKEGREIPEADKDSCGRVVRWCVIGKEEKKKCEYLATAALSHGLLTRLRCVEGASKSDCLAKVRSREADVVYIDTELGFISRKVYNLTAAAYMETQRIGNYYGVLVVKENSIGKFKDLKGKRACFPQYNGLGWLTYIQALKAQSIISGRSCPNSRKALNYFSQVCAPGAKDLGVNPRPGPATDRLCKGCTNTKTGGSCEATPRNPYFGEVGALRCLSSGDGDVAFLDFHAIQKYLSRENSGESDIKPEELRILCRDGSLEKFNSTNPDKCSFIQINGGEVATRNDLEAVERTDIRHTLMELDDLFGTTSRAYNPALKMFESFEGNSDVLFKDSAVSLVSVYETQNRFVNNYIKLLEEMENCSGDDSGSSMVLPSVISVVFSVVFILR